jgi:hypothetical protein
MTERVTHKIVAFAHPFGLPGIEGLQPPGSYDVETIEEQMQGLTLSVWRRVSTSIALPAPHISAAARQVTTIDPADLAAALTKDAETPHGQS